MAGVAKTKKGEKVFISEADEYLFAQGTHYDIYKKLGAHPSVERLSLIHICMRPWKTPAPLRWGFRSIIWWNERGR